MKVCKKCGVAKLEIEFSKAGPRYPRLFRTGCKPCEALKARERRARNPEAYQKAWKKYGSRNRKQLAKRQLKRHYMNPERAAEIARKSKYGVTPEDWKKMVSEQKGCCALCGLPKPLCVDHNHISGKVRGLLCQTCNRALGMIKDSVTTAQAAVNYLKKHS